LTTKQALAYYC